MLAGRDTPSDPQFLELCAVDVTRTGFLAHCLVEQNGRGESWRRLLVFGLRWEGGKNARNQHALRLKTVQAWRKRLKRRGPRVWGAVERTPFSAAFSPGTETYAAR
jgi:hypothetical protein